MKIVSCGLAGSIAPCGALKNAGHDSYDLVHGQRAVGEART
jgi:hypothetical protein